MKTDIKETETGYQLEMELPGYDKSEINAKLEEGYLTITAKKTENKEQTEGKFIRKERYSGSCARRFYVGKTLTQQDMKARFENGILTLNFPKEDAKKVEEAKYISIE